MGFTGEQRGWRGLLAALVLFVLAVGPGLDTLVCAGDEAVATGEAHGGLTVDAQDHGAGGPDVGHEACQHGHCHPVGAMAAGVAAAAAPEGLRLGRVLPSGSGGERDRQFGLMRPPRA